MIAINNPNVINMSKALNYENDPHMDSLIHDFCEIFSQQK